MSTPQRRRFVDGICRCFPSAGIVECPDVPHNKVDLREPDALARHRAGKRTLVFGELAQAVRFSQEEGNACPNYWHFSAYGFCPYGCRYCYLAGTTGVWFSPTVKIYVNLPEILDKIDRAARATNQGQDACGTHGRDAHATPFRGRDARDTTCATAFYLGKLQDSLALDCLTGYSTVLVPFFASHPYARGIFLTKSDCVDRLIGLDHGGHTILSWSLNAPEVAQAWDENAPSIEARLSAMEKCSADGYPVRAVLMPMIPVDGWQDVYARFIHQLLARVRVARLTIGGICSYGQARQLMDSKCGPDNAVSRNFAAEKSADGRLRYARPLRIEMYSHVLRVVREVRPELEVALCLEESELWRAVGIEGQMGRCNCCL